MTPPVLRVGWQTDQSANSKDLTFNFNPGSFQANPRLGNTGGIFNLPSGAKTIATPAAPPPVPTTCTNYFACYAGTSTVPATNIDGATWTPINTAMATSKRPCFPSVSGECDVTKATPAPINFAPTGGAVAPVASESDYKNVAKKYQYWAVKLKPYLETQFSL